MVSNLYGTKFFCLLRQYIRIEFSGCISATVFIERHQLIPTEDSQLHKQRRFAADHSIGGAYFIDKIVLSDLIVVDLQFHAGTFKQIDLLTINHLDRLEMSLFGLFFNICFPIC